VVFGADDELVAKVVPFLRAGVAAGEPVLLGVDDHERRLLLDGLGSEDGVTVLDGDHYARPYRAVRRNRRTYDELLGAGAPRVRVVGAPSPAPESWHQWCRYEAVMNHVAGDLPVWAMCLYDRRAATGRVLADVARTHPHVAGPDGSPEPNPDYTDPAEFLAERGREDVDPVEQTPPGLHLADPSPPAARRGVQALAATTGLSARALDGLSLAVTEVVTNALVHGRPPVTLLAWAPPGRVVVAVHDEGPGPADPYAGLVPTGTGTGTGGFGLHLAHELCDEVTLERGPDGFTVHLVAKVSGGGPAGS
jgi:anti-sigma regulatory factor (Ser/Thr protein kinase)